MGIFAQKQSNHVNVLAWRVFLDVIVLFVLK